MKIKDITEGWGDVANNLGKDLFGINRNDTWTGKNGLVPGIGKYKTDRAQTAANAQPNPTAVPADDQTIHTSTGDEPANQVLKDMTMVSTDPLVIQYGKGKRFHLNNQGQWAFFPGEKTVDQTTATLLTRKAEEAGL